MRGTETTRFQAKTSAGDASNPSPSPISPSEVEGRVSRPSTPLGVISILLFVGVLIGCKPQGAPSGNLRKIGIVTDVGGRGDQSFNDSALRGLEQLGAGKRFTPSGYVALTEPELAASLPPELKAINPPIHPLAIQPVVLQSKAQEDYEPNLQLLVDQGAALTIGVGFMLENAVETVAKRNPDSKFLLIDSPILDAAGKPYGLPNVRTVVFREEQGSFLAGALVGLATKTGKLGFVGGMEIPLIKKFEAGFRAGVAETNPTAAKTLLVSYTGSFDNVGAGKQIAQDMLSKDVDIVFHAAGSDGLGVIQAVKEAHAAGKHVFVIGVDSDQSPLAPDAVLTSMIKRVDLAVYEAVRDLTESKFTAGDRVMGAAENGVGLAPVRIDFPGKQAALEKIEQLRQQIVAGKLKVPSNPSELKP